MSKDKKKLHVEKYSHLLYKHGLSLINKTFWCIGLVNSLSYDIKMVNLTWTINPLSIQATSFHIRACGTISAYIIIIRTKNYKFSSILNSVYH